MSEKALTAYDRVLYPDNVRVQTHPDRLATIATLFGMAPAPVGHCRVLELGCGNGSNLAPIAWSLPESQFIGMDAAGVPIAHAQAMAAAVGLKNIAFHHRDILEVSADLGQFDYIICHGVFSWVPLPSVQKAWLPSNFRLKIDGLENACARVNKIEALTIKQKVAENPTGEQRDYQKEPGKIEFPNLVITFPESHAEEFYAWHEDFVIKGNCGDEQEKTGSLEYLSSRGESLFKLDFHHLGIFKLAPEPVEPVGENIRRIKAEMYCEEIKFSYTPAWV